MKHIATGSPFRVNWRDLEEVVDYAKQLGPDTLVFKHPLRDNYNITFMSRYMDDIKTGATNTDAEIWIVWRADQGYV